MDTYRVDNSENNIDTDNMKQFNMKRWQRFVSLNEMTKLNLQLYAVAFI